MMQVDLQKIALISVSETVNQLACSNEQFIAIVDLENGNEISRFELTDKWGNLEFSGNGQVLASGSKTIEVWDISEQQRKFKCTHEEKVHSVQFSPNNALLATGTGGNWQPKDCALRIWDVNTGTLKQKLDFRHPVTDLVWMSSTQILLVSFGILYEANLSANTIQALQSNLGQKLIFNDHLKLALSEQNFNAIGMDRFYLFNTQGNIQTVLWPAHQDLASINTYSSLFNCKSTNTFITETRITKDQKTIETLLIRWDATGNELKKESVPISHRSTYTSGKYYGVDENGKIDILNF